MDVISYGKLKYDFDSQEFYLLIGNEVFQELIIFLTEKRVVMNIEALLLYFKSNQFLQ
jgi:hypothetical protein